MRRVYIREREYEVIDSVYIPENPNVFLPVQDPPKRGIGRLLIAMAILVGVGYLLTPGAKAQSTVRQYYGWSDYGSNHTTIVLPEAVIIPVPIQPPQPLPMYGRLTCNDWGPNNYRSCSDYTRVPAEVYYCIRNQDGKQRCVGSEERPRTVNGETVQDCRESPKFASSLRCQNIATLQMKDCGLQGNGLFCVEAK